MSEVPAAIAAVPAARAALLVIDMQNAFAHPEGTLGVSGVDIAPALATVPKVRALVEAFRARGLPVLWTQQVHLAEDAAREAKALASHTSRRKRVSALSGSWDAAFLDEVADLVDDPTFVVTKHRFGAFYETRLQALCDMLGVNALFVAGLTANACVETTIREAYLRDFDVVAVTDAIAAVRPAWIDTAHAVWQQYLGALASTDEVLAWLAHATRPAALGLHHVLLECTDLDAALTFWTEVVGLTVRSTEPFRDGRRFVGTHQGVGLVEGGSGASGVVDHVCLRARGVDALAERARAAGVLVARGPGPGPYGHTVYLVDPDGREVELVEPESGAHA